MVVVKRIAQIREGEREHTLARQPIESNESKWQQFLRAAVRIYEYIFLDSRLPLVGNRDPEVIIAPGDESRPLCQFRAEFFSFFLWSIFLKDHPIS